MMKPQPFFRRHVCLIFFLVLIALILVSRVNSPSVLAGGDEWRPVDPADLALKAAIVEPNADAEAIFWEISIDDAGADDLVLSHYVRIKIFSERGRDAHSTMEIPFINGMKIKDIAARTIKTDGSIIELAKDDILERTVVKLSGLRLRTKSFALPGIELGAIIEYRWKEVISDSSAHNMPLQFQREIPVQAVTYRFKNLRGRPFDVRWFNMANSNFQKQKDGFHVSTVKSMPAFREEPFMPPEESVRSWAMVRYLDSYDDWDYEIYAKRIFAGFESFMTPDDPIKRKAAEITAGATTPEEKIEKIFAFCRTNIKNLDDKNAGITDQQLEKLRENKKLSDVLTGGIASSVEINLLFSALARGAGFQTRIVLLPDRGRRLFDPDVVVPGAIRPACIAVVFGEQWKFFDPGLRYITHGMLRWQEEGVEGVIANRIPLWIKTPMSPPEKSKQKRVGNFKLDEKGTLEGDVSVEYTGHFAVDRKLFNEDDSSAQREEHLKAAVKARLSSAELSNISIENATDPAKPFIYKYHVRVPEFAQRTGKRLFVQPAFFQKGIEPLFSAGTRRFPIYFNFPWSEDDKITVSLPKGYTLDNADRPSPIKASQVSRHEVKIEFTDDESTLHYDRTFFFGATGNVLFPVETYPQLKRLFDEVHKADNHLIILKQAGSDN